MRLGMLDPFFPNAQGVEKRCIGNKHLRKEGSSATTLPVTIHNTLHWFST